MQITLIAKKRGRQAGSLVSAKCCVCGCKFQALGAGNFSRCEQCKTSGLFSKMHRGYDLLGKSGAGGIVQGEIRAGRLPKACFEKCLDCGSQAVDYDHRDYNFPLVVEPVCRSCNIKRGPAIPLRGSLKKLIESGRIPYRSRHRTRQLFSRMGIPTEILVGLPIRLSEFHWQGFLPFIVLAEIPAEQPAA